MTPQFRLNENDCIEIGNVEHSIVSQGPQGFVLRSMDEKGGDVAIAHEEYVKFLERPDVRLLPGHFWAGRVAARQKADANFINALGEKAQAKLFWKWSYTKLAYEAWIEGRFSKTEVSLAAYMPELAQQVQRIELTSHSKRTARWDSEPSHVPKPPPCAKTLLKWLRDYVNAQQSPIGLLRKRRDLSTYPIIFSDAVERFMREILLDYLDPRQPTPACIVRETLRTFRKRNRERQVQGKPPLQIPSESTIRRRIRDLDQFQVIAHRRGPDEAKRSMAIYENGIFADYPMERVEMDEWEVDVLSLFKRIGIADKLDPTDAAKLNMGRRWISVAIDCATRCIVGFKISETPTTSESLDTVTTILRDKSDVARALGCECLWDHFGRPDTIYTDMGSSYANRAFRGALADLKIQYLAPPAAVPKLRGRIERLFGLFAVQLMELLPGRVFSNPKQRGGYPSQQQAVLNDDELLAIFVTFIVDIYHNSEHGGLLKETPANAWKRLANQCGVTSPPDANTQRAVLGIPLERKASRHGVLVNGIHYVSKNLAELYLRHGKKTVNLRLDPNDLGFVSIQIGTGWEPAEATIETARGMNLDEWTAIAKSIREKHRNEAAIFEDTIARALIRIRGICDASLRRSGKTLHRHSTATVDRARDDLFMGLKITKRLPDSDNLPVAGTGPFGNVLGQPACDQAIGAYAISKTRDDEDGLPGEDITDTVSRERRWRRRDD
ncbi:DDE-type integrase/transposase/recombinase [Roseovarius sp. M141]|uniref:Mu transposase C-terminal domain-containing protein n=1 Tax=Roseovarius sp. M141 TaxID=2583806 RepID=UPI0020CCCD78|nr:DDE-type integrase/transposase/recombinase [Roseovarius sp. M141]MCQ0090247.1 DDE-type integrase/transposase/recombinase [Roseovarius sp. M141]